MSARLRNEALHTFRDALDRSVGCVTAFPVVLRQRRSSDATVFAFETLSEFVRLRAPIGLGLRVRLRARIGPADAAGREWRATIVAYQYALLDGDGREYLTYHWHPDGVSHVTTPHLHLGPAAQVGVPQIAAAHLPTGSVQLPEVVRLAIEAFRARPLRQDWSVMLTTAARSLSPTPA